MGPESSLVRGLVELLLRAALVGMFVTQVWAAGHRIKGRRFLPEAAPRRVPWSWMGVVLVISLYLVLSLGVRVSYEWVRVAPAAPALKPADEGAPAAQPAIPGNGLTFEEQLILVTAVNALAIVLVPLILRLSSGATLEDLGLSLRHGRRDAFVGFVAFFLVAPWVYAVNAVAILLFTPRHHPLESMIREGLSPGVVGIAVVSAVIFAPAAEELIFRGVLLGWLSNPETPPSQSPHPVEGESPSLVEKPPPPSSDRLKVVPNEWTAIVASALPFALVHMTEMPAPFAIFVLALALGLLARRTGGLVAPLVLHGMFNGFSTMMLLASML